MSPEPYKKLRKQDRRILMHPCPECGKADALPSWKLALGQVCSECAAKKEAKP